VDAGWNRVIDADPSGVATALGDERFMDRGKPRPDLYGDGNAAARIVEAMERHHRRRGGAQEVVSA
jgi:UDP-N-acetylglucosamine 2-epimerase (non-hydrolysing)